MSDGPACPHPAEHDRATSSTYCVEGMCRWMFAGEPVCPHPVACDRTGKCTHPVDDSHEDWRELNAGQ